MKKLFPFVSVESLPHFEGAITRSLLGDVLDLVLYLLSELALQVPSTSYASGHQEQ